MRTLDAVYLVYLMDTYWAGSNGRRNTRSLEIAMNAVRRRSERSGRAPLPSPGRPSVAGRNERNKFWRAIAAGLSSEDAVLEAGLSQPVGSRLFRKAGGMPPAMFRYSAKALSGRYLSLIEREEIALLRVQGHSIQKIGRRLGRAASTVSRELRRNAATRGGALEYRATTAQWHADRSARRPKPTKLALNATLRIAGRRRSPERRVRSWSRRSVEGAPAWPHARIGDGPKPGALSRLPDACRLTSRTTRRWHQPRSYLSSSLRSGPWRAAPRADGLLANRACVTDA